MYASVITVLGRFIPGARYRRLRADPFHAVDVEVLLSLFKVCLLADEAGFVVFSGDCDLAEFHGARVVVDVGVAEGLGVAGVGLVGAEE